MPLYRNQIWTFSCDIVRTYNTCIIIAHLNQHHLERRPVDRNVATWQTSEVVGMAPKICNSDPDAIFK